MKPIFIRILKMRLKTILLFLFLNIYTFNIYSQNFKWVKGITSSSNINSYKMTSDTKGNIYAIGTFLGTASFGSIAINTSIINGFVCKLDTSGNFMWAKKLSCSDIVIPQSISIGLNGSINISGDFKGTLDADPSIANYNIASNGVEDIFIIQLDSLGNFNWGEKIGNNLENYNRTIVNDSFGNIYLSGYFKGNLDVDPDTGSLVFLNSNLNHDLFIIKLNSYGSLIWGKKIGGTYSLDITQDFVLSKGFLYLTGSFNNTVDFDPGINVFNILPNGDLDVFVLKLDTSGNFIWAKNLGGLYADNGRSIAVDENSNVFISGVFTSIADFDPGLGVYNLTANNSEDVFLCKLDSIGNFVFAKKYGSKTSDFSSKICIDECNNCYHTGFYTDSFEINSLPNQITHVSNGSSDLFVKKVNNEGEYMWSEGIGSSGAEYGVDVIADKMGNYYTYGTFKNTIDFDPSSSTSILNSAGTTTSAYIQKFCILPNKPMNISDSSKLLICYNKSTVIAATGKNLSWYSQQIGGLFLGKGDTFKTINLTQNTTFYVQDSNFCGISERTPVQVIVKPKFTIVQTKNICKGNVLNFKNKSYSISGNYYDTLVGITECDTFLTTILIVNIFVRDTQYKKVCIGKSVSINNHTYSIPGIYFDTIKATIGCDSIITTILSNYPANNYSQSLSICSGQTIKVGNKTYSNSGLFKDTLVGKNGCDSFITTNIVIVSLIRDTQYKKVCIGKSVSINNHTYSIPGIYFDTIKATIGCDSIITTILSNYPANNYSQSLSICSGQTIKVGNKTYSNSGLFKDTLIGKNGCDSFIITNLTVNPKVDSTIVLIGKTLSANQTNASYQWVDCSLNSNLIGANFKSFTPTKNGNYSCVIKMGNCSVKSKCIPIINLSLFENNLNNQIFIYPIPSSDYIIVESYIKIIEIDLYNIEGKLVFNKKIETNKYIINLNYYPKGQYRAIVKTSDNTIKNSIIEVK